MKNLTSSYVAVDFEFLHPLAVRGDPKRQGGSFPIRLLTTPTENQSDRTRGLVCMGARKVPSSAFGGSPGVGRLSQNFDGGGDCSEISKRLG
jgi:hypothetical protein